MDQHPETQVSLAAAANPNRAARQRRPSLVSWAPSHDLDAHEWAAAGQRFGAIGRGIQWMIGDWIAYGNARFGERYARAAKVTGYDTQTLMNMVYVASRFPVSRRRENLSWSHHEALASFETEQQEQWLEQALAHRWSVADMRTMLRTERGRSALPKGDAEEVEAPDRGGRPSARSIAVTCPRCGGTVPLGPELIGGP